MHQAGEYFSAACGYYANGEWEAGDRAIDEANKHIEIHDNLVDNYNEYLANIRTLADEW